MNRTSACLRAGRLLIVSIAVAFAWPALPQGLPIPPRHDSTSPTGVSFATGTFTYTARDLSIGGGEFPEGLTLDRTYISNLSYYTLGGHGWTHNWFGTVNSHIVPPPMGTSWTPNQEPWVFDVSVDRRSVGFSGGSTYPPSTSTSLCRTSAATGIPASPCAVAGDEVLTQYDYGPNSGAEQPLASRPGGDFDRCRRYHHPSHLLRL